MGKQVLKKELFTITEDHLETGMRGYPVGYCPTSSVDPEKGLFYAGHPVTELAFWEPEKVIFLLYHRREGSEEECRIFKKELEKNAFLEKKTIQAIENLPREGHPMKLFSAALLLLGMCEGVGDYQKDALRLIAKIPILAATVINYRAGWGTTPQSEPERGYIENFIHLLQVPIAKKEGLTEVFKVFNILHYDHGGGNLSTFVGKAVASGLEDLFGSLAAAMCALAGSRHGKANQDSLAFLKKMVSDVGENATTNDVERWVEEKIEAHELIYGFGHAVLRIEDPRATLFYEISLKKYPNNPLVRMAHLLRECGSRVLKQNPKVADPYPNVDAISGTLLSSVGFPYPEYFTLLFGMARVVGISIQIVYERCEARGGKGTPIIRPKYYYGSTTT